MFDAVEGEVEKVRRLIDRGTSRYLLITNVSGTAHLVSVRRLCESGESVIIRSTYKQGASDHLLHWLFREHATLPDNVVDTILTQAKHYLVDLWELAEAIASQEARRAIQPVGRVAREEQWFAT